MLNSFTNLPDTIRLIMISGLEIWYASLSGASTMALNLCPVKKTGQDSPSLALSIKP